MYWRKGIVWWATNSGKLEEILEGKLRKVIQPLSKQIEDAMQSVNALNSKYDQIAKTLKDLDEAKDKQILVNASLKAEILKSSNEVKFLMKSLNDLEQYTRRDCLEIQRNTSTLDTDGSGPNWWSCILIGEEMGVPIQKSDISISHRILSRKQFTDAGNPIPPAIIIGNPGSLCVSRDITWVNIENIWGEV